MAPKRGQNKNQNNSGANNNGGNRNHRRQQGQSNNRQHRSNERVDENNNNIYRRPPSPHPNGLRQQRQQHQQYASAQPQDRNNSQNQPRIGMRKLEELLEKPPEHIVLAFRDPKFRIEDYLNAPTMGDALIFRLAVVLNKAFECNSIQVMVRNHIDKVLESVFFKTHLYDAVYRFLPYTMAYNLDLIETTIYLCSRFLLLHPLCQGQLGPMKDRLELLVTNRLFNPKFTELFNEMIRLDQDATNRNRINSRSAVRNIIDYTNIEPPNDITEMNIVPKLTDIFSNQTSQYLRKNITNGAYQNVQHYLDVQFRLLREDYLLPLRDGVQKLREIVRESRQLQRLNQRDNDQLPKDVIRRICRIESLSAYFGCSIEKSVPTEHGIVYEVRLSEDKNKKMNWDVCKKLLFGSLVCLSNDYFENMCLIGSICERDPKKLKNGVINVKFNIDFDDQWNEQIPFGNNFIMLETSAYFESYKYVLQALVSFQRDGENNFPFKENLVYCQNSKMLMPKYLTNMHVDFRPLVDKNKKMKFNYETNEYEYIFSRSSLYAEKCYLSNQATWPNAQQMGLDESQYNAVRLALENKLALIQGPPGTGKTFIGVKLVELLLHNKHAWWNRAEGRRRPILMICYTNHALDQFLEYCIDQCSLTHGVVRVGGQSKSDKLGVFMLSNIKRNLRQSRQIDANIHHRIKEEFRKLKDTQKMLEYSSWELSAVLFGGAILRFDVLCNYMDPSHINQLVLDRKKGADFSLLQWLGFFEEEIPDIEEEENVEELEEEEEETNKTEVVHELANILKSISLGGNQQDVKPEDITNNNDETTDRITDTVENAEQFDEINEEENKERILEDDAEMLQEIEAKVNKALEAMNSKRNGQLIICSEIEEMRSLLNQRGNKGWKKVFSNKERRDQKTRLKSEMYMRKLLESSNRIASNRKENIHLESNINRLGYLDRFLLYQSWIEQYKVDKLVEVDNLSRIHNEQAQLMKELRLQEDRQVLEEAYIVAMTTTGSSRYHSVLKDIGPRIVIVEEAAEVFESHIVASLSKNCEHLILIGDHVQLRPNPAVYKLAKDFEFDVSLFERLINNDTKKVMLSCQHRMRPEISELMKHFYDQPIQDHDSVRNRDPIVGLRNNIFFITHDVLEDRQNQDETSTTKMNRFEAEYVVKLAQYLIKQRQFQPEQITILSMYLGQMSEIRKMVKNLSLGRLKCMTVDNYQGEENEIIILSLVRSNRENRIGFLSVKNRACVALSRARCGFYVIGNFEFISRVEKESRWANIINSMKLRGAYGKELILSCNFHRQNDMAVKKPSDFDRRPNGGCHLPCEFRLKCGHQCALSCHAFDREHKEFKCKKQCEKIMPRCGHQCRQQCSHQGECNRCTIKVNKIIPGCGHMIQIECDREPKRTDCTLPCERTLPACGHKCTKRCGELVCEPCQVSVSLALTCRHGGEAKVKCSEREQMALRTQFLCAKKCGDQLECGHKCNNKCGECLGGYIHNGCDQKCDRFLFCGHQCPAPCSNECQPCTAKCENRCVHSKCQEKCSEPCVPCREPCAYECPHFKCTKKCGELCNRPPCNEPCGYEFKKCGHPCIGFCGEPCPPLCRICDKKKLVEFILLGKEDEPDARFVWLEDCGHCIEASAMDYWIESRYGPDAETDTKNNSIQLPECPRCKTPIRSNLRYSNYVKMQLDLIEKIKLKQYGDLETNKADLKNLKTEINKFFVNKINDEFSQHFKSAILQETNCEVMSFNELAAIRNTWTIYQLTESLDLKIKKNLNVGRIVYEKQGANLNIELDKLRCFILDNEVIKGKVQHYIIAYKGQKLNEILDELQRIDAVLNYYIVKNEAQNSPQTSIDIRVKIATKLAQLEVDLVKKIIPYRGVIKRRVEESFKELQMYIKVELSKEERAMIVEAMGLGKGHWYKCPNGHPYAIGECGGAMQKARCPDCNAEIGGQQHRLTDGNTHAGDFDGSSAPAWPQNHLV